VSPKGSAQDPKRSREETLHVHINGNANGSARLTQVGRDLHLHLTLPLIGAALLIGIFAFIFHEPLEQLVVSIGSSTPSASADQKPIWPSQSKLHPSPSATSRAYEPAPSPTPTHTPTPTPTPTSTQTHTPTPTPTPTHTPDPLDAAFAAVHAGDCLNRYNTGWGDYNSKVPITVDCRGGSAYNRVRLIATSNATCPTGTGRDSFPHLNDDNSMTVLCLERQFLKNQCFLATTLDYKDYTGSLNSVFDCQSPTIPKNYNVVMVITTVITKSDSCPPVATGRHGAEWTVLDGSTKVCAVILLKKT
jgi:hypothetical protein